MSNKVLTIHKNTSKQRRAKEVRAELLQAARHLAKLKDISGFAIVGWNEDCTTDCNWKSTAPGIPALLLPEYTKRVLLREMGVQDTMLVIDDKVFDK